MLKTRILTALCILPVLLAAMFFLPALAWAAFTLIVVLLACWEWRRFCGFAKRGEKYYVIISVLIGLTLYGAMWLVSAALFQTFALGLFCVASIFWFLVVPLWLAKRARLVQPALLGVVGWLVIFPTWLAFISLREISPWALLSFAVIVWVADIAAYFAGKKFGKHKLAPMISPGKTIEGVIGGLLGVLLYFLSWALLARGSDAPWIMALQMHLWLALMLLIAVLSVVGDLFESMMKRGANLKDSSNLLPGHGGILDRIDALTSTLPIAALVMAFALMATLRS